MKVLFVFSKVFNSADFFEFFVKGYLDELKKVCDVKSICFNIEKTEISEEEKKYFDLILSPPLKFKSFDSEKRILETSDFFRIKLQMLLKVFNPDVIHATDIFSYLPFRLENNIFYSFCSDLKKIHFLENSSSRFSRLEKICLETKGITAVYSKSQGKKLMSYTKNLSSPLLIPCAVDFKRFKRKNFENECEKLKISYFGNFETEKKNLNDFVFAVNSLGKHFKEKFKIEYTIYGTGSLSLMLDYSLIDKITSFSSIEISECFKNTEIAVIQDSFESSFISALEAMASGCLVLTSKEKSLESFIKTGFNSLEIPNEIDGMAKTIQKAVEKFSSLNLLRKNAVQTAKEFSWQKSVKAHFYFYQMISKNWANKVCDAYRFEVNDILEKYKDSCDVEKIFRAEAERKACIQFYKSISDETKKILFITANYLPEDWELPENVSAVSTVTESEYAVTIRPECLPFKNEQFDIVAAVGSWETVLNPCSAILEMQRISSESVVIFYNSGFPLSYQVCTIDFESDWKSFTASSWKPLIFSEPDSSDFESLNFKVIEYKKENQKENQKFA